MYINRPSISAVRNRQTHSGKSSHENSFLFRKAKQQLQKRQVYSLKDTQQKQSTVPINQNPDFNIDSVQLIQEIFKRWDKAYQSITSDIKDAQKATQKIIQHRLQSKDQNQSKKIGQRMQLSDYELQSFERCQYLLQQQYQSQKMTHYDIIQQMGRQYALKALQAQKINQLIRVTKEQKNKQNKELQSIQEQLKQYKKKIAKNKDLQQKISSERQKTQSLSQKLFLFKEKSLEQKQQYIEQQRQEFSLTQQIQLQEQEQQHYSMLLRNKQRQKKLQRLKIKLRNQIQYENAQASQLITKKIAKAALIRTNLKSIDEVLEECYSKIEQQNFMILALKSKAKEQQNQQQQNQLYNQLKNRYEKIYFQSQSPQNRNWNEYKQYLQYLLANSNGKDCNTWQLNKETDSAEMSSDHNSNFDKRKYVTNKASLINKDSFYQLNQTNQRQKKPYSQIASQKNSNFKKPKMQAYLQDRYPQSQDQRANRSFSAKQISEKKRNRKTQPKQTYFDQQIELRPFKIKKIERRNNEYNSHSQLIEGKQIQKQIINLKKLPRIRKKNYNEISKNQNIKQEIKRQIEKDSKTNNNNKKKVQIVSVGSSQQCQSGQFIEVQFYNANKKQFSKKMQ